MSKLRNQLLVSFAKVIRNDISYSSDSPKMLTSFFYFFYRGTRVGVHACNQQPDRTKNNAVKASHARASLAIHKGTFCFTLG